jgi:hypothetical protein
MNGQTLEESNDADIQRCQHIEFGSRQCEFLPSDACFGLWIELMSWSGTLVENSIGGSTFRKTRVDNSGPAHKICFRESSATNRLAIAAVYYGNEPDRFEPPQIFRV